MCQRACINQVQGISSHLPAPKKDFSTLVFYISTMAFQVFLPVIQSFHRPTLHCTSARTQMSISNSPHFRPVIVADVMDTLVKDPFFNGMAAHFGFSTFDTFIKAKNPHTWPDFELGKLSELNFAGQFFLDKTPIDLDGLKSFLRQSYTLLPGIAQLLTSMRNADIPVHLCSNYPVWYEIIESELRLSDNYDVKWTFVSARDGIRKPDLNVFHLTAERAGVNPDACILLDDRQENCDSALRAGYLAAIRFQNAQQATAQLNQIFSNIGLPPNFQL